MLAMPACTQVKGDLTGREFHKQVAVKLNYLLYLPEDYGKDPNKKWPLILFLHGSGERGTDVNKVKIFGFPNYLQGKKNFPFIAIAPQCPPNTTWESYQVMALLDEIQSTYAVDVDRTYLTGLSMGGFAVWDIMSRYPGRFAAYAPVCGAGNSFFVKHYKDVPVWVFHGDADNIVPVQCSDDMVEALKAAHAPEVKYTRYVGVGHDSWTAAYNNPELYEWFLAHKRVVKQKSQK